ncbi:hypothetical protein ABK040_002064 [Willaertia magna]
MREPSISFLLPYPNDKIKSHRFGINKLLYRKEYSSSSFQTTTITNNILSFNNDDLNDNNNNEEKINNEYSTVNGKSDFNNYTLFSAGRDGTIKCWNLQYDQNSNTQNHNFLFSLEEHVDWVNDMILLKDKRFLISCSNDNTVMLWNVNLEDPKYCLTYRTHTDYVKCLASTNNSNYFCSGGLDCSIFIWDAERLVSIVKHYEKDINNINNNYYDIQNLQGYYPSQVRPSPKHSIYTLAMSDGSFVNNNTSFGGVDSHAIIAAGSTDQNVRIYDVRSAKKITKLRGHKDNVRSVLLTNDGLKCFSGSTDGSVRYWDLRTQRCLNTFYFNNNNHSSSSIWSLEFDPYDLEQNTVVCGTRDGNVYYLDTKYKKFTKLVDHFDSSILTTCIIPNGDNTNSNNRKKERNANIWIGTSDSSIFQFEYGKVIDKLYEDINQHLQQDGNTNNLSTTPKLSSSFSSPNTSRSFILNTMNSSLQLMSKTPTKSSTSLSQFMEENNNNNNLNENITQPKNIIKGSPAIIKHHILNDRKKVLAKDTEGRIILYDITTGKIIYDYGLSKDENAFDLKVKEFTEKEIISVRNWFTIERKLGCLEVVLNPNDCFNAENYAIESGFLDAGEEDKVNFGVMMVKALFNQWKVKRDVYIRSLEEQHNQQVEEKEVSELKDLQKNSTQQKQETNEDTTTTSKATTTTNTTPNSTPNNPVNNTTTANNTNTTTSTNIPPMNNSGMIYVPPERTFFLPDTIPVIIHFEKTDTDKSAFKKLIKDFNGKEVEGTNIPEWISHIMNGGLPTNVNAQSHKLSFYLEPLKTEDNNTMLPALSQSAGKLFAHRILRIYRVSQHIVSKLGLQLPNRKEFEEMKRRFYERNPEKLKFDQQFDETLQLNNNNINENEAVKPEEYLEISCYGNVLKNRWNLAIANTFFRPNNVSYIVLNYKRRYPNLSQNSDNVNNGKNK